MTDTRNLRDQLVALSKGEITQLEAIENFEGEMRERTSWGVLMSRQACVDAHSFKSLNKDSAILGRTSGGK
jgi:hypothetical protein